jgi:pentatricopeptide repeat protein
MSAPRRLPPTDVLMRLINSGATYHQIGAAYGTTGNAVGSAVAISAKLRNRRMVKKVYDRMRAEGHFPDPITEVLK